ncbi:MAG: radical SAM family heme chaperone HemW [Nitrospirota bacterium]|nr:radical SAM family heme chaperone HemW [Nitrospirota bacterium]
MDANVKNVPKAAFHREANRRDIGLYLHVPFCVKRCHFCAFYLVMENEKRMARFLAALDRELELYRQHPVLAHRDVSTVYLGGGTPTALSRTQLSSVLVRVARSFSLTADCEVTVEATPESLTREYLNTLLEAGVTRLSIGIQTFVQEERIRLGLSSTIEEATAGIRLVKPAGFTNVNIDLMYGIPGQSFTSWENTLRLACEWEPTHLSCYALSVEEGTRFDSAFRRGEFRLLDSDREKELQLHAIEQLELAGFCQYEISNWSKSGFQCRHNRRYWQGEDVLGLGPSAQSYVAGCRFGNVANLEQYCLRLEHGDLAVTERETLSIFQQHKERVVFGLRMLEGVPNGWIDLNARDPAWAASLASFLEKKYLVQTPERVALTAKGRQFADEIGSQLL